MQCVHLLSVTRRLNGTKKKYSIGQLNGGWEDETKKDRLTWRRLAGGEKTSGLRKQKKGKIQVDGEFWPF